MPLLSLTILVPLAGLLVLLCLPSSRAGLIRVWANLSALATFGTSLLVLSAFDRGASGYQLVERVRWIPSLGADWHLGVDGVSLLLLLLTTVVGCVAMLASWTQVRTREKAYYATLLLQLAAMVGVFLALDFLVFFVLFEFTLVPMYFLIGVWGSERRTYAAIKFFLYTLAGSLLLLLAGLRLYFLHAAQAGRYTFEIAELTRTGATQGVESWVLLAIFLGFAVKVPMFPLHTWLPDAHVQAPTAGSVILAGVLLKLGTYGFLRLLLPLLQAAGPDHWLVQAGAVLSIVGILYGALVSLGQSDWKKLIAYSSVSHLGFCTLGLFSLNANGVAGSVLQQVNHGLSTSMLFLVVGMAYERRHTREIAAYGGLAHAMPGFALVFAFAMFSSMGLPLLNGFVGEFTIMQGAFQANPFWAAWAVPGVVLGAAYLLWLYQRTMLGPVTDDENGHLPDLSLREWAVYAPLIAWSLWIGLYPKPHFDLLARPAQAAVQRVAPAAATNALPAASTTP